MDQQVEGRAVRTEEVGTVSITIEAPEGFPLDRLGIHLSFSRYDDPLRAEEVVEVAELMGGIGTAEPLEPGTGGDTIRWKGEGATLLIGLLDDGHGVPEFRSQFAAELAAKQKGAS